MDPSNDGTVIYKKRTVVVTVTTADGGKATSKKLPLDVRGFWKCSPDGFILKPNGKSEQ